MLPAVLADLQCYNHAVRGSVVLVIDDNVATPALALTAAGSRPSYLPVASQPLTAVSVALRPQ